MNTKWLLLTSLFLGLSAHADYSQHDDAQALINELIAEEGLSRDDLEAVLGSASYQQSIVDAMNRPAERVLTWADYRAIFMGENRISGGAQFWRDNAEVLAQAESEFGVPARYIVAIIGVETLYGRITGNYRVVDALATLAFDYPARATFFRSELKHFLTFTSEHQRDPLTFNGSYAGAMGLGQFMPSSYRNYARDYTGDGFADLWESEADAIWSVANYLQSHGWRRGAPVAEQVTLGEAFDRSLITDELRPQHDLSSLRQAGMQDSGAQPGQADATLLAMQGEAGEEYWLGYQNFYVITRYNISALYALAVFQVAEAVAERYASGG
jgi:membrane-bound lytic murein transglycosylase B